MGDVYKRYVFSSMERSLPVFIESIGYSPWELTLSRPQGYPYYHWLQTIEGEGSFTFSGTTYTLGVGKGILLTPCTPHSYHPIGGKWSTLYVTFGGAAIDSILGSLEINYSAIYSENAEFPFSALLEEVLDNVEKESEFSRLEASKDLYHFLIMLKKYGMMNDQPSLSQFYDKIRPVVEWLEQMYPYNVGLSDMAERADMSVSSLNALFQETFGLSPYAFLIQLRIREAKRILFSDPKLPLHEVAVLVGFNDVSHFVSTFRKKEGMTPKLYRRLHLSSKSGKGL